MSAADRLRNDGFSLSLNDCGALVVAPAARLDDATRAYIRQHLGEIKAALRQPFIETSRIHRAWRLTLADGTRLVAVRPAGATRSQILEACADQFGAVIGAEPAEVARP